MWTLTKPLVHAVLTEIQQQEISPLTTIASNLAYTSDISQCNKARKWNRSLGLKGYLGILVHIKIVLDYLGRSHRNKQVLLRGEDIQRQSRERWEHSRLLALTEKESHIHKCEITCLSGEYQIFFLNFQKQSQTSQFLFTDIFLIQLCGGFKWDNNFMHLIHTPWWAWKHSLTWHCLHAKSLSMYITHVFVCVWINNG